MMDFPPDRIGEMSYPTRVSFGNGAISRLPEHLERLRAKRPLLVTDAGVAKAGLVQRVAGVLRQAGLAHELFDQVESDPTEKVVLSGLERYRSGKCDGLIALGGGSPLDAAKLIRLLTTHEPPLSRYDGARAGDQQVQDNLPPLVAVPTTAGTGSEVSPSAVVTLKDSRRKMVISSPFLMPEAAICDPQLTVGLPPGLTASTGMDAFAHCLEAFVSSGFHPLADAVAIDGISRVMRSLETAFQDGKNLTARADMMVAAMEGAMALQKGLGACHSLAQALTPVSGVHHGLASAICLPAVLEFNRASCTARLARVAVAMGDNSLARQEVLAGNAVERVRKLNARIGIPARLREVGVKEADLAQIARTAFEDASHHANPRRCTEDDLLALAREVY